MSRFVSVALLVLVIAVGGHTQSAAPAKSDSHAYYSKGQADAGKALYAQNCSKCHLETLKGSCAAEMASRPKTYVCAGEGTAPPLIGKSFMERFYGVGDLYIRTKW